jgi:hypothetical protein
VCENARHFCSKGQTCQITCDDPQGCDTFVSDNKLRYGCATDKNESKGSEAGMVVGLCVAIVAIVGLSFALYYYVSIAPTAVKDQRQ